MSLKPVSSRSLYFENSGGRIWEEAEGFLRLEYRPGSREIAQFRALLTHVAQALHRRGWSRILVDQRAMTPFSAAEQDWMSNEWLPQAVREYGYRHGAVLVAQDVFARLAMNQLMLASRGLNHAYRTFGSEAEAVAWLAASGA
jgi:hypothetical protein